MSNDTLTIEVWSDVACPFCYIGEQNLEVALADFAHRDDVEIVARSFELDPSAPAGEHRPMIEALAKKFGSSTAQVAAMQRGIAERAEAAGLAYDTTDAQVTNTFDAHRLVHLAAESGKGMELLRALMQGYFAEGLRAGDPDALVAVAREVGHDEARVREVLAGDEYADAVRADQQRARSLGVGGVPFFLIADRYALSGAQPVETFRAALEEAWAAEHPITVLAGDTEGAVCTDDSCAL